MIRKCEFCKEDFEVKRKEVNRGNGKFCSLNCAAKAGNISKRKNFYAKFVKERIVNTEAEKSIGNYIAGFVDGEGSFIVSLEKTNFPRLRAMFKVELTYDDFEILDWLKTIFGVGNTYVLPSRKSNTKAACRFVVQDLESLVFKVIPFFHNYQLQGKKKQDYIRFADIITEYIYSSSSGTFI